MTGEAIDSRRLGQIDALFDRALDLEPGERPALLDREADGDPELRAAVVRLLAAVDSGEDLLPPGGALAGPLAREVAGRLESSTGAPDPSTTLLEGKGVLRSIRRRAPTEAGEELPEGTVVGPYRILGEIGRGGMAVVYRAERADGSFSRRVAVKLLRRGTDTDELLRRFAQERQILASLDHPGIARLLDGGATADGRPFLAMELVEGEPIDHWCRRLDLGVAERLRLFVAVGRAVEHAHRNLVVHRDLKPSNVLVDGEGQVKLLDFGIAKLLDPGPWPGAAPATRTSLRPMTPEYASPEQVRGEPVTLATDVYQLGLLLYELLTGRRPFADSGRSRTELERAICEQAPAPPSTAVAAPATDPGSRPPIGSDFPPEIRPEISPQIRRLRRQLRGDLDNVVLKALRKEPERRYAAVGELVADVERHLAGKPVRARPDTWGYRTAKFVRRHRWALAAAASAVVAAVGLTAFYTVRLAHERDRARQEAAKAARVARSLTEVLRAADPALIRGGAIPAREVLDRGVASVRRELADPPELRAALLQSLAEGYGELDLNREALPLLEEVLAVRRALLPAGHPDLGLTLSYLGLTRYRIGDYSGSRPLFEEALALQEKLPEGNPAALGMTLNRLGNLDKREGRFDRARALLERALALQEAAFGPDDLEVAKTLNNLALLLDDLGETAAARDLLLRTLAIRERATGPEHPRIASTLENLSQMLTKLGDHAGALALVERSLALRRRLFGEDHLEVAMGLNSRGVMLRHLGRLREARTAFTESLAVHGRVLDPDHPHLAYPLLNLADTLNELGDAAAARPFYARALAIRRAKLGPRHSLVGMVLARQAGLLRRTGDLDGAEALLREALAIRREALPAGHPAIGFDLLDLGSLLLDRGDPRAAEPLLAVAVAILEQALPAGHEQIAEARSALARCRGADRAGLSPLAAAPAPQQ